MAGCIKIVVPESATEEPAATTTPEPTVEPDEANEAGGVVKPGQTIEEFVEYVRTNYIASIGGTTLDYFDQTINIKIPIDVSSTDAILYYTMLGGPDENWKMLVQNYQAMSSQIETLAFVNGHDVMICVSIVANDGETLAGIIGSEVVTDIMAELE